MNTGLPSIAASDALPPVTVGPAVAGAGRRFAPVAVATTTSARQARAKGECRRITLSRYRFRLPLPGRFESRKNFAGVLTHRVRTRSRRPWNRRYTGNAAHSRALSHSSHLARRCRHVRGVVACRASVCRVRRPVHAGRPIVGRCADQGRHVGRDSRYRSLDLQAGRSVDAWGACLGSRGVGEACDNAC